MAIYVLNNDSYRGWKKSMANINTMDGICITKKQETTNKAKECIEFVVDRVVTSMVYLAEQVDNGSHRTKLGNRFRLVSCNVYISTWRIGIIPYFLKLRNWDLPLDLRRKRWQKRSTIFVCSNCGYESGKWLGKCPACNEWNSFYEEKLSKSNRWEV